MSRDTLYKIVIFVMVVAIAIICGGCKTRIVEVPIETTKYIHKSDTLKETSAQYDSIYVNDSTYIARYDSILKEFRGHYEIRYKILSDTVEKIKEVHDSTRVEIPVRVEVEKDLNWYEEFCMCVGKWTWWIWILLILLGAVILYRKIRKR